MQTTRVKSATTIRVSRVPEVSDTSAQVKAVQFSASAPRKTSSVSVHEGKKSILDRRGTMRRPNLNVLQLMKAAVDAGNDDDDEEPPKFCSMSSHDWLCNCQLPRTVRQVSALSRQKPWRPNVYERTYVLPPGCSLKQSTGENGKNKEKEEEEKSEGRDSVRVMSGCPISARQPFLVLSPYWAKTSRRHLQQWPWRGALHCGLWSFTSGHDVAEHGRHKNCFCKRDKLTTSVS